LEFNVPFQHKYGYIRDENGVREDRIKEVRTRREIGNTRGGKERKRKERVGWKRREEK